MISGLQKVIYPMQNKNLIKFLKTSAIIICWMLIWQISALFAKKGGFALVVATPLQVAEAFLLLLKTKDFYFSCLFTIFRVVSGWAIGLVLGTLAAFLTSKSKIIKDFISPVLHIIKATPVASFIVLALVLMKSGKVPVFTGALISLPVVWGNLSQGFLTENRKTEEMADIFKLGRGVRFKYILLPKLKPFFVSGAITSLGLTWKACVAAEVICTSKTSIGAGIYNAKVYLETPSLFAWTACVIILSVILEKVMKFLLVREKN